MHQIPIWRSRAVKTGCNLFKKKFTATFMGLLPKQQVAKRLLTIISQKKIVPKYDIVHQKWPKLSFKKSFCSASWCYLKYEKSIWNGILIHVIELGRTGRSLHGCSLGFPSDVALGKSLRAALQPSENHVHPSSFTFINPFHSQEIILNVTIKLSRQFGQFQDID